MNFKNYHQKKRFGQHWLVNKKILEKIIEVADEVMEEYVIY